jgi:hypothetical protein
MTHEHEHLPKAQRTAEVFGLTRQEELFYRISDTRFQAVLNDHQTTVHAISLDGNNFGEYLFVTLSREVEGRRYFITLYGLGYHEQREQWVIDEWYWYEQRLDNRYTHQALSQAEAKAIIQKRRDHILTDRQDTAPSERAVVFGLLADLSDEDAALTELNDLDSTEFGWGEV